MMTLLEKLKKDRKSFMKSGDKRKSNMLGVLIADATKQNKAPDDASIIKTIKSIVKRLQETKDLLEDIHEGYQKLETELSLLNDYLPEQLSEEEIKEIIRDEYPKLECDQKRKFSLLMKHFKADYSEGTVDMKLASSLIKELQRELEGQ